MAFIDSDTIGGLGGVLTGFASLIPVILAARQAKKVDREWKEAGLRHGLVYTKSKGRVKRELRGEIDGFPVGVEDAKERKKKGKGSRQVTRFELEYPPSAPTFALIRAEPTVKPPTDDEQFIRVGHDQFDRRLRLTGDDPAEIVRFFTPPRRERALRVLLRYPRCIVSDESVRLTVKKTLETGAQIDEILKSLLGLTRLLAPQSESAPVAEIESAPPPVPEEDEPLLEEAELEPLPEEELEPEPEVESEPPPEPASAPAPVAAPPEPLLPVEEVGAALFGHSRMGSETEKVFAARFQDHPARGAARLVRIDTHSSLPNLGTDSDHLAVLEVPDPTAPGGTGRPMRVLIPVSDDETASLRAHVGHEVAFEGRLVGCNPYLRDLHVEGRVRPA